jgi:small VCP/p97-interacting protein
MGNCFGYFDDVDEPPQEDLETRRQRQAEAAARRQQAEESRGLKNPQLLKAKQAKREEIERNAGQQQHGDTPLKVNTSIHNNKNVHY